MKGTTMKNLTESHKSLIHAGQALLLAALMLSMPGCSKTEPTSTPPTTSATSSQAQLMFVQSAEDIRVNPTNKTVRLIKVNPQTLYFSDRPVRMAGHLKMADYLTEWTAKAGKDNFGADPPNATLSVYEPGQPDNTIIVVEILNPIVEGSDITYTYKIINGTMPVAGGATALFIDWIGAGGGVGRGFHGVGVGGRGVGRF
jgi:hypothetical protein